ncbi:MAG: cobalamin biosynthesis protein [Pseudomonadota bacterium]
MIVAGFGFRSAATLASLEGALEAAWVGRAVDRLAVPAEKANAAAIRALAEARSLPLITVSPEALARQNTLSAAPTAVAERFAGSPAEAAALAAAGPGARLDGCRSVSPDRLATCAIAIGDAP